MSTVERMKGVEADGQSLLEVGAGGGVERCERLGMWNGWR